VKLDTREERWAWIWAEVNRRLDATFKDVPEGHPVRSGTASQAARIALEVAREAESGWPVNP
jgi:hypothetical protein